MNNAIVVCDLCLPDSQTRVIRSGQQNLKVTLTPESSGGAAARQFDVCGACAQRVWLLFFTAETVGK